MVCCNMISHCYNDYQPHIEEYYQHQGIMLKVTADDNSGIHDEHEAMISTETWLVNFCLFTPLL